MDAKVEGQDASLTGTVDALPAWAAGDADLARHFVAFAPVTDCPIRSGNAVTVLPEAMTALRAMWRAMADATRTIALEFYTFEDIAVDGQRLSDLLVGKLSEGVRVAVIYDGIGSDATPEAIFERLRGAGALVMPFRSLNPFRRQFSFRLNDRDHRKILVVDDRVAFLGGVNIDSQYLNPRSNGMPPDRDTTKAFWEDAAAAFEGPCVPDALALFRHTWTRQGGDPLAGFEPVPDPPAPRGGEAVCVEGSAPREGRPLHLRALFAALDAARSKVWIASGYFVPTPSEIRALAETARRGVDIRIVLPGVSDVPAVVSAARASYGKLLEAGIHIHEIDDAVLHAKVSTIDGVWTSIGSSNLDRRSAVLNNEVDAVVFGRATAGAVEARMRAWFDQGVEVTLADWRNRSTREHALEVACLGWRRLM